MQTHEILFDQRLSSKTDKQRKDIPSGDGKVGEGDSSIMSNSEPCAILPDEDQKIKFLDWGFKVDRLFEVAHRFYKRNENKAFHISFDERNKMTALVMQAKFGNFDGGKTPDIGVLDLVGKRRQHEWSLLKGMTRTEAMTKFVCELDDICPIFKAYAEAVKISSGLESSANQSNGIENGFQQKIPKSGKSTLTESSNQLSGIYTSLCKQTHSQFKSYAEKQYPGDSTKQKQLVTSLQEQYYQQYISQMDPRLRDSNQSASQSVDSDSNITSSIPSPTSSINEVTIAMQTQATFDSRPKQEAIKVNGQSLKAVNFGDQPNLEVTDETTTMSKTQSKTELVQPSIISDINCEEGNVQTDISCEELNSELDFDINATPNTTASREESKQASVKSNSPTPSSNEHLDTKQSSFLESVKVGHNFELPPIGAFESFPEPKLLQNPVQKKSDSDSINPNLPNKVGQTTTNDVDATKSNGKIAFDRAHPDSHQVMDQSQVISPRNDLPEQDNCHQDSVQITVQNFLPIPEAYSQFKDDLPEASTTTEPTESVIVKPQTLVASTEPSYDIVSGHLESWGPVIPSPDRNQAIDMQITYNHERPEPATIWTKKAVFEFKESLSGDKQGGVYEVKEGALIVIQVPTYADGKYIYWEFATDTYDIGFGVDFVYESHLLEPLAINIYQDNDGDDDYLGELVDSENWSATRNTIEDGPDECRSGLVEEKRRRLANTISILPTYRRDSHEEVFVGRHKYPSRGYYLLKFDNTYSVLRSKTLYFRICYFM